jgi:hypothetical protein
VELNLALFTTDFCLGMVEPPPPPPTTTDAATPLRGGETITFGRGRALKSQQHSQLPKPTVVGLTYHHIAMNQFGQ